MGGNDSRKAPGMSDKRESRCHSSDSKKCVKDRGEEASWIKNTLSPPVSGLKSPRLKFSDSSSGRRKFLFGWIES